MPDKSQNNGTKGVMQSLDWWTVAIYIALLIFGWISVCGASYTYGDTDIFSLSSRSGMQIVWIVTSISLGFCLLMTDDRLFDTFAYVVYAMLLLLLFATIFNPHEIKGSRSWLVLGPLRLQPAEFAKFATALAVSKLMSTYGFSMRRWKHAAAAAAIVMLPMLFIVAQKETGSALVYLSFSLMFYREGMPVTIGLMYVYCHNRREAKTMLGYVLGITAVFFLFAEFVIPFDVTLVQYVITAALVVYLLYKGVKTRFHQYVLIGLFAVGSVAFFSVADYVLNDIMQPHQRVRINVLLGLEEDLAGAGYNVHQSEIAIGSGGLQGKGFLNGTQTKLKFVPEQDTDFIFCTVGEEEGFLGSAGVLLLFLALILRLIKMAERQPFTFGRIYGYCVLGVFLFHVFINVGMVLGLTPVIGIPLPFFSYGGSSLWGFTLLLFIFLRIDASRNMTRQ